MNVCKDKEVNKYMKEKFKALLVGGKGISETESDFAMSESTQEKIFALQKAKQDLMSGMRERLTAIKENKNFKHGPTDIAVTYDNGFYYLEADDLKEVSFGEILSDIYWGNTYLLDDSVPIKFRKRYELEKTKHDLRGLLDEQVVLEQVESPHVDEIKRQAYVAGLEGKRILKQYGHISEMMVESFFKTSID